MKGKFIVLEGPDGSGTTTHVQRLRALLEAKNIDVLLTKEPTNGLIGQDIRRRLHANEAIDPRGLQQLFTDDRAQHVAEVIRPALEKGQTVISDRYRLSTIVYGAAQGLDERWLRHLNADFPAPDLTVITLPPFAVCLARLGERAKRDQLEEQALQRRVYDGYTALNEPKTVFVDTSGSAEQTTARIWEFVQPLLEI